MSVIYSEDAITDRLQEVVNTIGGGGQLLLYAGSTLVASTPLENPCGTVNAGVLTFTTPVSTTALADGTITFGQMLNGDGTFAITALSVGVPSETAEIIISNGVNSLEVTEGQTVALVGAQIVGS